MAEYSSRAADVLIVGGGIIGCSIALRLAQGGMKVTVLDRAEPGAEASSAAAGMLAPVGEVIESSGFAELCVASRNIYPAFAAEIEELSGHPVGYRNDGSLLVALTHEQEHELAEIRAAQSARGFALHALTAAEIQAQGAGVSPQARGGLFIPSDHWVDNVRLTKALVVACQRAGVRIEAGQAVHQFRLKSSRIESVKTEQDCTFHAKTFILAAGSWSGELGAGSGIHIPVAPCRGQMLELESQRELPFVVRAGLHYLVPRADRHVVVGTTSEYVGFEKIVTADGIRSVLEGAKRLAPVVGEYRFLRAWAGLRPDTSDHLPILGYGDIENLVFATGHFRNGILLTPITAEVISDLVIKGSASHPLETYRPTRFKELADRVVN